MKKKVLITSRSFGSISNEPMALLEGADFQVDMRGSNFNQEEFEQIIPEYDALIIGAHEFPEAVMERCSKLKVICKHGVGLDNIPLEKAKELGIAVCNAPGTNSNAVADLTIALMLSVARRINEGDTNVHKGPCKAIIGVDVCGKELGLLGFGAVAKCVARRAKGFGMHIKAYDPYVKSIPEEFQDYVTLCDLKSTISQCDFLSVHMPLTNETHNMIDRSAIESMRPGSFLINSARGGIVDESALYDALVSGHIAGAAMDVMEHEPIMPDHPLLSLQNVVVTPHMGMYSKEAIGAVSIICARNVVSLFENGTLENRVV